MESENYIEAMRIVADRQPSDATFAASPALLLR
jgi:hypothetical protein